MRLKIFDSIDISIVLSFLFADKCLSDKNSFQIDPEVNLLHFFRKRLTVTALY